MRFVSRNGSWPVAVLLVSMSVAAAEEEEFKPLFDGKTLDGWTVNCLPKDRQFAREAWTVDRGTLLANTIGHKEHFYILLATREEYGDFVLRLRFQAPRGVTGNSGIQIRSRYNPKTGWMEGPQIDIDPPNPRLIGKLWNEGPGKHRWLSNEPIEGLKFFYSDEGDGWNDLEISAQGMRIRSVLNGVTVVDYDGSGVLDDALHTQHRVGTRGVIGLQIHSYHELKLRFKDIRIKELGSHRAMADDPEATGDSLGTPVAELPTARMLTDYFHRMSVPKPLTVRHGDEFQKHRKELREKVFHSVGLWPLPRRVPLDVHESTPLDHPWCTVRRVYYQLWPEVYSAGLLYMPKKLDEEPAPAMLCPHGHWSDGNAHPEVQKRCLNFARLGYVTFSSTQNHYEDLYLGISHQTQMIWNNIRALDYLESLAQADKSRFGVAGASGGGLQTQMLVALDDRVRAATIVGLTCDFREIMFADRHYCTCNHFPGVMRFTDHPELSTLGLPAALQFLTMNDWTKNFERDNLPAIRRLYAANGVAERVDCRYYDTPHSYDKQKRERTYQWMQRWVKGRDPGEPVVEPDEVKTFPVQTLKDLSVEVPQNKGFGELSRIYEAERGYRTPSLATRAQWQKYRQQMLARLKSLLGMDVVLPRVGNEPKRIGSQSDANLLIEHVGYPSEGGILVPTLVIRPKQAQGKLPVAVVLSEDGHKALLAKTGAVSVRQLALDGSLVALPDVRCHGRMLSTGGKNHKQQWQAWERNGIVWGRPVPGMACTDIQGVLDGLAARADTDISRVKLITRRSGGLALAALFAAAVDSRVTSADVDLAGSCFQKRNLPLVSCVLQYGDVLQWAALLADRALTLRNVPPEAGNPQWLRSAFVLMHNGDGLRLEP